MSRVRPEVRNRALRLRRYIKDPSTIRMMLSYEYGLDEPLPTRTQIVEMRDPGNLRALCVERGIA